MTGHALRLFVAAAGLALPAGCGGGGYDEAEFRRDAHRLCAQIPTGPALGPGIQIDPDRRASYVRAVARLDAPSGAAGRKARAFLAAMRRLDTAMAARARAVDRYQADGPVSLRAAREELVRLARDLHHVRRLGTAAVGRARAARLSGCAPRLDGRARRPPLPVSQTNASLRPPPLLPAAPRRVVARGGRAVAQAGCVSCHQLGTLGPEYAGDLALTTIGSRRSPTQLAAAVRRGPGTMPSYRRLPSADRAAITAFLASLTVAGQAERALRRRDRRWQRQECRGPGGVRANLDGDGRPDRVTHTYISRHGEIATARLFVCLGDGRLLTRQGIGMSEELEVIDIDGDGRAEIYYGANSVCQSGGNIAVVRDGRLRLLRRADGRELWVTRGCGEGGGPEGRPQLLSESAWGCRRHWLVLVAAQRTGQRRAHVTSTLLRVEGLRAARVASTARSGPARDLSLIRPGSRVPRCPSGADG